MLVTSPCYLGYLTFFSRGNYLKSVMARLSGQRYLVTPVTSIFFIYTKQSADRDHTFVVGGVLLSREMRATIMMWFLLIDKVD